MTKKVYMDHNATTPVDPEVLEAMLPYLKDCYGNASSVHEWGKEARYGVEKARMQLGELLGVSESTLTFTSCGSESNNTILRSVASRFAGQGCHIIASAIEHPCIYRCLEDLENQAEVEVSWIEPDGNGVIHPDRIAEEIRMDTRLVSIMLANNETGVIQPIQKIAQMAHEKGIKVHSDTVQGVGKIPVDLEELGVDFATFSAHKLYGPKGIGAFYARDRSWITPMILGGGQENRLRAGTESVPMIVAFGAAAEKSKRVQQEEAELLVAMRDDLEKRLLESIPEALVCGKEAARLPGTLCVCFPGIMGTYLVLDMAEEGIAISSGSACSANQSKPSHVLIAMGIDSELARGAVRLSLGRANSPEQIEEVANTALRLIQNQKEHPPEEETELDLLSLCD
ncbi:MAG: cysteine desulfurase [Candidatus Omnitrophica bacterium]|nr:cysteine desulfurase [Candidatus Omnitrophota bacterium]MCB9768405.1 cysteine desulfurase [Candidatus Omnitrophota bacterium]